MSHRLCFIAIWLTILVPALAQTDPQPEDFADWVDRINNSTLPLPSCADVGIQETLGCSALCQAVDGGAIDVSNSRNVNGKFVCTCADKVACNDQPTCSQLTLQPGRVEEGCTAICGDRSLGFEDSIEYAGSNTAADRNMTHFVLECRCDGEVQCSDSILFSDLSYPTTCTELSIDSTSTCDDYCASKGGGLFDLGGNYSLSPGTDQGICDCMATSTNPLSSTNIAQACSDVPVIYGPDACTLQNPCPTEPPSTGGSGSGSGVVRLSWGASVISTILVGSASLLA
jgi:hypothetical protein